MAIFDTCRINASFDEMLDSECNIKEHWIDVAKALKKAGIKKLEQKQFEIDWRLEDNGVTYNIYKDPDGTNRKWNLDPILLYSKKMSGMRLLVGLNNEQNSLNSSLKISIVNKNF